MTAERDLRTLVGWARFPANDREPSCPPAGRIGGVGQRVMLTWDYVGVKSFHAWIFTLFISTNLEGGLFKRAFNGL